MAIEKAKVLPNGSSGNYWKIISESYDNVTNQATWIVALFTSKSYSDDTKPSLNLFKKYSAVLTDAEMIGNRTKIAYTKIMAKAESMVRDPMNPEDETLRPFDSDLAGGTPV